MTTYLLSGFTFNNLNSNNSESVVRAHVREEASFSFHFIETVKSVSSKNKSNSYSRFANRICLVQSFLPHCRCNSKRGRCLSIAKLCSAVVCSDYMLLLLLFRNILINEYA